MSFAWRVASHCISAASACNLSRGTLPILALKPLRSVLWFIGAHDVTWLLVFISLGGLSRLSIFWSTVLVETLLLITLLPWLILTLLLSRDILLFGLFFPNALSHRWTATSSNSDSNAFSHVLSPLCPNKTRPFTGPNHLGLARTGGPFTAAERPDSLSMSCWSWSIRDVRLETKMDMKIKVKHAYDGPRLSWSMCWCALVCVRVFFLFGARCLFLAD